ncbi:protein kinase domain-containing protein [Kitasatospora paranensis]|uniref:non-specific serine/threonine protein kinase n=1 Tax=Kitasatospora paranensis TaxID=258053 RepID=A0ABW2FQQ4_9ACTN
MIGRALNGRYELVEILGVGGMATVYRGVDRQLGRQVAVKVLNGGLADDPRFAERFGREAQHAAMLVHPRIVMVFDSGVDEGSPYIVMELVQGRTLGRLLAEQGPLPVDRAVGVAAAVCEALEVAHGAGLVHRDVKPGNIMITDDGGVKVVDFGIARAGSSAGQQLTQTATVLGTAAYLSPEQATAAPLDGRSDLYAVGCVLVEMLTGEPPFAAETPVAIAFKHVSEQPAPVSVRRGGIPPALDVAVMRLLAKQPEDRPAHASAARAELLAAVPVAAAADRTSELLGAATQVLPAAAASPGFPAAAGFGGHPYSEPNRTSVLPPTAPPSALGRPYHDEPEPGPEQPAGRSPWLFAGAGVAVVAAAVVAGVLAFGGPPAGRASAATPGAQAPLSAGPSTAASPAASSADPTPTAEPSPTAKPGAALQLLQLRQDVAGTDMPKDRDRKAVLLGLLDSASTAVANHHPDDAVQRLHAAQKVVRDLVKRHAVDSATGQDWQSRLGTVIGTLGHQQNAG